MAFDLNKLKQIAKPETEEELKEARFREENGDWLEKSALIALELERMLRIRKMSRQELAELMKVSPAQVTKILSGKENLGLKTICKIEKALEIDLLNITERGTFCDETEVTPVVCSPVSLSFVQVAAFSVNNKNLGSFASAVAKKRIIKSSFVS